MLAFYSIYWVKCYAVWLWANKKWIKICQITWLKPQFPFHIVYLKYWGTRAFADTRWSQGTTKNLQPNLVVFNFNYWRSTFQNLSLYITMYLHSILHVFLSSTCTQLLLSFSLAFKFGITMFVVEKWWKTRQKYSNPETVNGRAETWGR